MAIILVSSCWQRTAAAELPEHDFTHKSASTFEPKAARIQ
jgi:hypothetical protein